MSVEASVRRTDDERVLVCNALWHERTSFRLGALQYEPRVHDNGRARLFSSTQTLVLLSVEMSHADRPLLTWLARQIEAGDPMRSQVIDLTHSGRPVKVPASARPRHSSDEVQSLTVSVDSLLQQLARLAGDGTQADETRVAQVAATYAQLRTRVRNLREQITTMENSFELAQLLMVKVLNASEDEDDKTTMTTAGEVR